jgi:hypothetical protein
MNISKRAISRFKKAVYDYGFINGFLWGGASSSTVIVSLGYLKGGFKIDF